MSIVYTDDQNYTDIADAIRAKNGSADTYTPSEMATAITDLPTPTPVTKGLVFSDYDSDGYPHKAEFVGMTSIPLAYGMRLGADNSFGKKISSIQIPDGVTQMDTNSFFGTNIATFSLPYSLTRIDDNSFSNSKVTSINLENTSVNYFGSNVFASTPLASITLPATFVNFTKGSFQSMSSLTSVTFLGNINAIPNNGIRNSNNVMLYDFSHCSAVPPLYSTASLGHASGCVIKVPSALLSTWQNSTNWIDLQNVTWQGV